MNRKTALVTGGAKRIGREIALFLARECYNILLHYNSSEKDALQLKSEIEALGVTCKLGQANFLNDAEVHNLFINDKFDLLVNNASIFKNDNIKNINYLNLDTHLKANLYAPAILTQRLLEGAQSNIINVLDYSITKMPKNFLSYALSKKFLWEFTKLAAYEMAPLIRVNAIGLGNSLKSNHQSQINFEKSKEDSPLKITPSIKEICQTINFILKTPSMTGQIIFLDGGKHLNIPEPL